MKYKIIDYEKDFVLFIGIVVVALNILFLKGKDPIMQDLLFENVEAMAGPEVDIEAICMGSYGICIVYSNGYFIRGQRVA